jgi:hypothetical protein
VIEDVERALSRRGEGERVPRPGVLDEDEKILGTAVPVQRDVDAVCIAVMELGHFRTS